MAPLDEKTKEQIMARVLAAQAQRPQMLTQMKQRQQQGLEVAHKCAGILKQEFGAERVVLFGSMLNPERVTWRSDIDLAVWGLPEVDYFRAVGRVLDVDPNFSVDLVEVQHARPSILEGIHEGIEL